MDPYAIDKATVRLNTAKAAWQDLESCTSFERFEGLWHTFLVSSNGVYTILEKGAKALPRSRQWFGGKKNERRRDQLLQYLAQARDDDEHGLGRVIEQDRSVVKFLVDLPQYKGPLQVRATCNPGEAGEIDITSVGGKIIPSEHKFPYVRLIRVHDRGGKPYDPPNEHLGVVIAGGDQPDTVARLAISYLIGLVADASKL